MTSAWAGASQKLTWRRNFNLRKSRFWERHFFTVETLSRYLTFLYLISYLFFLITIYFFNWTNEHLLKTSINRATSKTWTPNSGLGPWTWTLKDLDSGKPGPWKTWYEYCIKKYVWLQYFIKTMRNVICS